MILNNNDRVIGDDNNNNNDNDNINNIKETPESKKWLISTICGRRCVIIVCLCSALSPPAIE
jgi:hypothetical protein